MATTKSNPEAVLAAVGEVMRTIATPGFDLQDVLETVIQSAVELSGADFGNILRPDEGGAFWRMVAAHGEVKQAYLDIVSKFEYTPDRGSMIGRTLLEKRPVQIEDVLADPEYTAWDIQKAGGYRTLLSVPMIREGEMLGLFVVLRYEVRPFSDSDIAILETFADQAVLAYENARLLGTIATQRAELARYAPQAAELLSSTAGEQLLAGHRREITTLFCDLRGFTAFAESAEPEEVLGVLRDYHALVGGTVVGAGGTVEHFAGDGQMSFFNDPAPVANHQLVAVRAALAIREGFEALSAGWLRRGYELGLGIGLAVGYATIGRIGFEGRFEYGAVGNVVILASRLSDAAAPGEILISQRLNASVEGEVPTQPVDDMMLKGFGKPVQAFRVT
jgi:adenylate cyclase